MKFCINCANFVLQDKLEHRPDLGLCSRVERARSPVTGAPEGETRWQYASVVRRASDGDWCGPRGVYFVEKEGASHV